MRILLVEDDASLQRGLDQALDDAGHASVAAGDGASANVLLATAPFDLLVLDLGLPKMDGVVVLERLQSLPVLILSARYQTRERVLRLDRGADDYLTKTFELAEFEARVRALLRRGQAAVMRMGALPWSREAREATLDEAVVTLTRHEANLLEALIQTVGRTVAKATLALLLGDDSAPAEDNLVEAYVHRLRRKLGGRGVAIRTVRGLG